jgi:hypothetical protein
MKIPTMLLERVLLDVGLQFVDTIDSDYREICSRYGKEGMGFLTITLPTLDDALLKGLSRGRLNRSDFPGFRPVTRSGSLPRLLSGFFKRIFHTDGSVLDEPDVCAISAIRQVTRLFKKVELPCSKPRIKAAYERYESNDREVDWRSHRVPYNAGLFASICGYLWSDLEAVSELLYCSPGIFGIGATAERKKRNERFTVTEWPERAESSFPSSYHAVHNEDRDNLTEIKYLTCEQEQPVRVVQVPKTLKTPRTISVEPSYMMLMQQSIAKPLMVYLESKRFGFKSIRFSDQSVNNRLARLGSIDGSLATIDLKDASDMVDLDLVREIFRGPCPTFLSLIEDCRTTRAKLPGGTIIPLRKFASMGSAMCFPIESMVFFTIVMYTLVKSSGKVPSRALLQKLSKRVAIYGDDIIVDSSMAPDVMASLEDFGLRVNRDKSFHTGLFRESCGGDYYKGVDVTPVYVRQWDESGTLRQASHKVAYVALSNTFYMKGLWHACQYLRDGLANLRFGLHIPKSRHPIGVLHYISFVCSDKLHYNARLHEYRVKGLAVRSRKQDDAPSNMGGFLLRAFASSFMRDALHGYEKAFRSVGSFGSSSRGCRGFNADRKSIVNSYPVIPGEHLGENCVFETAREEESESYHGPYSSMFRTKASTPHGGLLPVGEWYLGLGSPTLHLSAKYGASLYTSDRPHALCLKRGWTASQAGLDW